jgi:hypothetical protein
MNDTSNHGRLDLGRLGLLLLAASGVAFLSLWGVVKLLPKFILWLKPEDQRERLEVIYRRFNETSKLLWIDVQPENAETVWFITLGCILSVAFFYTAWMYLKDSASIGLLKASGLGVLRAAVYLLIAGIFLLPALRNVEKVEIRSEVVLMHDISLSMLETRDDPPPEKVDAKKMPTRQEKVLAFLGNDKIDFIHRITARNPIVAYRFGTRLDEGYYRFENKQAFSRTEWEGLRKELEHQKVFVGEKVDPLPPEFWRAWLVPHLEYKPKVEWDENLTKRFKELDAYNLQQVGDGKTQRLSDGGLAAGTNLLQSINDALNRELKEPVQGLIIVTDGRSNLGSLDILPELKRKARENEIPIIIIGVGSNRPQARVEIVDIRLPKQIQPDDNFRIVTEVKGDGHGGDEIVGLTLEMTKLEIVKDPTRDADVEKPIEIALVEQRAPKKANVDVKPETDTTEPLLVVPLGKKLLLQPFLPPSFDTSPRPRASVEYPVDATNLCIWTLMMRGEKLEDLRKLTLPALLHKVLESSTPESVMAAAMDGQPTPGQKGKLVGITADVLKERTLRQLEKIEKWGLAETRDEGNKRVEYRFKSSITKDKLDTTPGDDHLSKSGSLRVLKKPLSVLLFSSSTSRDYQFLREILLRETQKDLARLTIVLQPNDPSLKEHPTGTVQGISPKRFLVTLPGNFDPEKADSNSDAEEMIQNLASYDVIIALDADWERLPSSTCKNVAKWVDNGGGLIVLGGPIYTKKLAAKRITADKKDTLGVISNLLPVVLKDVDVLDSVRTPDAPWKLEADQATSDLEFLKLAEETDVGGRPPEFLKDWDLMYGSNPENESRLRNGFYSIYPVSKALPGNPVVFRFGDKRVKPDEGGDLMPYFVITDARAAKRVVWIGSCETWRLRQPKVEYHERFWTKLMRYAGARTQTKLNRRITMELGGPYKTGQFIEIDAKILGKDGAAYNGEKPKISLKPPAGIPETELPDEKSLVMKQRQDADGMYTISFPLAKAGDYGVELTVPGTGDKEKGTIRVDPSNPEIDDTRPDFTLLYQLASEADDRFLAKIPESRARDELLKRLVRPKGDSKAETEKKQGKENPRLFFDLGNADLIPSLLDKKVTENTIYGKIEDIWDKGTSAYDVLWWLRIALGVGFFAALAAIIIYAGMGQQFTGLAITLAGVVVLLVVSWVALQVKGSELAAMTIPWVLLVAVGLWSAEWLIRKLLRLA